ncbi:MAG TPA: phosphoserine transaminase [Acidimicrobiales bacterium]|jgi:phosphoserine aminotransferase|nr:phosphoserine transaminase [Acidimicrobiales bacterium]
MTDTPGITIPADLLPADGRFGSGPSKVRPEAVEALFGAGRGLLGTSHRQAPVRSLVGAVQEGLHTLFDLPDGWEVVLGNGGSTLFWDIATFGLIERRSEHLVFGEFSSKFADAAAAAPHLDAPHVIASEPGTYPRPVAEAGVDVYAFTHNETSTGVMMDLHRPEGVDAGALVVVDATSGAGGLPWSAEQVDVYYFAPQKCFAADGGLWIALCSPAAVERIERIATSDRWIPAALDLSIALANSRQCQTYNTPAIATLVLLEQQLRWMLEQGGLAWCVERCRTSSGLLYGWADDREWAKPFVTEPDERSLVVGTVDLDPEIDAATVCAVLRENDIVDTDAYRKLGRNQLRVGMFPAVEPTDVHALTRCIDHVVEALQP